jgi:site-specific DNA-methyltransferase (adenine-specific)
MDYQMQKVMFSSQKGDWATPKDLYDQLDREFHFTVDVCANSDTAKHTKFWTENSGLYRMWSGETCFMNPPYGRSIIEWIAKAHAQTRDQGVVTVALLPARTDTEWFWNYILNHRYEIRLIKGRLKFSDHKNSAPFPSMIVIFK